MTSTPPSPAGRQGRTFVVGAGLGFITGAFIVATVVWQFGNVIGSRAASVAHPANPPSAVDRWVDGSPDDDVAVLEPAVAVAATPEGGAIPPATSEGAGGTAAAIPSELADRDLLIPVEGILSEQLSRTFDDRRGGARTHQAIDILAPLGTPVKAVEDGTIARLFQSKAGGITIYQFDPTERFCYYYAHLDRYADGLQEGAAVRKGQVLGYVGISGNAPKDTPHLHFAVYRLTEAKRWWEGTPLDPYDLLR